MSETPENPETPEVATPAPVTEQHDPLRIDTNLQQIIDFHVALRQPMAFDARAPFIVVPNGLKILDAERHMPVPSRVRKTVKFTEADGFLDYFSYFKPNQAPRIFSKITKQGIEFLTVFDYDAPAVVNIDQETGEFKGGRPASPQWNTHTAQLNLNYHRDYQTLIDNADKWHGQEDFALFIEENTHLFVNPDSATMLELAQELKGYRNVGWKTGKRLSNGRVSLEFIETIEAKSVRGDVEVPETLQLISPIFEGFAPQNIIAAFRYRLDGNGGITFSYRLLTKLAERAAEEEVKTKILETTKLPIYAVSTFDGLTHEPDTDC